jgi:cell division protein FtsI (penicillin-binding protein 3)
VLGIMLIVVGGKLVDLQVASPTRYRELSADQRMRTQTLSAERGTIYDRSGVELAVSVPRNSVFVDPELIGDPASVAVPLAAVLGVEVADVLGRIEGGGRFAYVARHVSDDMAAQVTALGLPGVGMIAEPKRTLPSNEVAGSVIGLTDIDGNGLSGLEAQFADLLTGTPGSLTLEKGPDGRTIPVAEQQLDPAVPGHDIVLTIDRSLQFETERILLAQVEAANARGGVVVVANPATGEILTMANATRDSESGEVRVDANNAAVTTSYEPGSVMKMITASGAVEEGLVDYSTTFVVPDTIKLGDWDFSEHTPHGTVTWPLPQLLSNSSNVGTIQVAQMLGQDRLHEYLTRFGLGSATSLGFPNEQRGMLASPENWSDSDIGSIPLGQSVAVTPLQMLMAYNVVANGGVYVPPRLVLETVAPNGERRLNVSGEPRRVVSEDTADMVNMMLRGVVAVGTGTKAAVEGYPVAGKTGTAIKAQPNGTYFDRFGIQRYQATFVGFVPATAPALSILVMIDEPGNGNSSGGAVAAPVFAAVAEVALRILNIPPPATDRAERFADALPAEARPLYEYPDGEIPRVSATLLPPTADGRVRAVPVGVSAAVAGGATSDAGDG